MTIKFAVCKAGANWIVKLKGGNSWKFATLSEAMHGAYLAAAHRETTNSPEASGDNI